MLDKDTKQRINSARQILVGKVPDPKAQVEQITNALIYKFMDDMDRENEELGGKAQFLTRALKEFSWGRLMSPELSGTDRWDLYTRALTSFARSEQIPELFRTIFKDAYLPYRDPETLNLFLKEINGFSYSNSENLGNAFEYLLSILGSQGDAGQFRTPRHIIDFIVEVVNPQKNERILDPACGTAGFLISSYKHIRRENSSNYKAKEYTPTFAETESADMSTVEIQKNGKYRGDKLNPDDRTRLGRNIMGYDISPDMVRLSLVNLYLHGFSTPHIYEYDTLTYEERWRDNFDIILANPPFMTPKGGIRPHKLFQVSANRAELLFVDYIAEHLTLNGRGGIIVPEGIIFQSANAYKALRKMLVDENYLYAVVSLPAGVFQPYSGVKTSILFLDKQLAKKKDEILFVKVENDGFDLGAQRRRIEKNDLPEAFEIFRDWQKGRKIEFNLALWVKKKKIAENGDYNLTGDRYRDAVDYSKVKWPMVKLGEVCDFINGRAFKPKDWEKKENGGLPIIRIQNLNNPKAEFNYYSGDVAEKLIVRNSDLLFSWSGSRGTSFGPHIWNRNKAILNQHIFRVEFSQKYIKEFLYHMLKKIVSEVESNLHGGVGLVHITKGNLKQIQIPLPPLEVLQQIVAELDGYQKVIDGARQVAENWKPRIKINPDWPMVKLGEVCENLNGKRVPITKPDRKPGNYPYYGAFGIVDYVDDFLFDDDLILISEDGANLLARVTPIAFSVSGKIWVNNHAHVLKFQHIESQKFVETYVNSINIENYVTGMAQPKLNQKFLNSIPIPFPPLEVQQQIVTKIEKEQKMVEECKKLIAIHEQKIKDKIAEVWGEE